MRAQDFGMFDSVKLKTDLHCADIHGGEVRLGKGKNGCVLELGQESNTIVVEFKVGRGMRSMDFTQVEVEVDLLEIESKVGRRFSEPNPYAETVLAIKDGTPTS